MLFGVAVVALIVAVTFSGALGDADSVASIVGAAAGVASLVLAGVQLVDSRRHLGSSAESLGRLARVVHRQWADEAAIRHVLEPDPINLGWALTPRPVSAPLEVVLPGSADRPATVRGGPHDLAGFFETLPRAQLVVLGEPGSGKSALAMLLAVALTRNQQCGPAGVPVIVPLGSWNPQAEHLDAYVIATLISDYPFLAARSEWGASLAERFLLDGQIVPVLDGLDEVPPALQTAAFAEINRAYAADRPVVLTCRGDEYQRAVEATGKVLASGVVIEIQALTPTEIVTFLSLGSAQTTQRWQPIFARLRREPAAPVSQALSTALFVTLAQSVFASPDTDPRDLLRHTDRRTIENELLDRFVTSAYEYRPAMRLSGVTTRPTATTTYPARKAHDWLAFLAQHMSAAGTRNLAWWHLARTVPAFGVGLTVAVLTTLPLLAAAAFFLDIRYALASWLPAAVIVGTAAGTAAHNGSPVRFTWHISRSRLRSLGLPLTFSPIVAIGLFWSNGHLFAGIAAAVVAMLFFLTPHLMQPIDTARAVLPFAVLRRDRLAMLGMFLAISVVVGGGLAAIGLLAGTSGRFALGFALVGPAVALVFSFMGSYGTFLAVRIWLAANGRLPWRLRRFLDDAHQREVLRKVGVIWQFRHARLQDLLAGVDIADVDRPPDPTAPPAVPVERIEVPAPLKERLGWTAVGLIGGLCVFVVLLCKGWVLRNAVITGGTVTLAAAVFGYHMAEGTIVATATADAEDQSSVPE